MKTEKQTDNNLDKTMMSTSEKNDSHSSTDQSSDVNNTQDIKIDSPNSNNDTSLQSAHTDENVNALNRMTSLSKQKKNRKSPPPEVNIEGFNTCSISRDDIQSPAYSDISDDSTSVNEQQLLERQQLKASDIIKKSIDSGVTPESTSSTSGQRTGSSPLSNYGVYQFYQQQQYLVQTAAEPHQLCKGGNVKNTTLSISPSSPTTQNTPLNAECNKKESHQNSNQSTQNTNKEMNQAADSNQISNSFSNLPLMNAGTLNSPASSKPTSHLYAFK